MEKVIINGEWRRDNTIKFKASLCEQEPGQIMRTIKVLDKGETPALPGDTDQDVINYFSAIYPGKQIVSKVL
jgi:hypothetical protein